MTTAAVALHFLEHLFKKNKFVPMGDLKSMVLGMPEVSSDQVLTYLTSHEYILVTENQIEISPKGREFIRNRQEEENARLESLIFDDYDLALLSFFEGRGDFVHRDDFPEMLLQLAPKYKNMYPSGNLAQRLLELQSYIESRYKWYRINAIGKAFYRNKMAKQISQPGNSTEFKNSATRSQLTIPEISEDTKQWLTALYGFIIEGKKPTYREIWSILIGIISPDFHPRQCGDRIVSSNGEHIRIMGLAALKGNFTILDHINTVIPLISKIIVQQDQNEEVMIDFVAEKTGLTAIEVSLALELASYHKQFYKSTSRNDQGELTSFNTQGDETIFYNYLHFKGAEEWFIEQAKDTKLKDSSFSNYQPHDAFNRSEIQKLNEKLDFIVSKLGTLELSSEFTYNDVIAEFEEMKKLYPVGKKNWLRLFMSKTSEVIVGGVASELISKPIADIIRPVLKVANKE